MSEIRWLADPKRSLVPFALAGVLIWLSLRSNLAPVFFLGLGIPLFPVLLLLAAALGGWVPAMLLSALFISVSVRVYGPNGAWFAVYLLPALIAFLVCLEIKLTFYKTAAAVFGALVVSVVFLFLIFQAKSGGDLYGSLAQASIEGLDRMPGRDSLLYSLLQAGFISPGTEDSARIFIDIPGGQTFAPEVISEFYKQLRFRIGALASSFVPGLLTTYAIYLSTLGVGFALQRGIKYKASPHLGMPPFSLWHFPRAVGKQLWILAAGYLLALLAKQPTLQLTGQMMYNVFFSLYVIQGLAWTSFRLRERGRMSPGLRLILLALLFFIAQPIMMFIGILDQVTDGRKLRATERANTDI